MRVYLAGAMHQSRDPSSWRDAFTTSVKPLGWEVVNPIKLELNLMDPMIIVRTDLGELLKCDALLARCHEPSWGTPMEVMFAFLHRVPVVTWVPCLDDPVSPWLIYHSHAFVETEMQAIVALSKIQEQTGE